MPEANPYFEIQQLGDRVEVRPSARLIQSKAQLAVCLLLVTILLGCTPSGPPTIKSTSAGYPTLAERINVLEQYVTFRRTYQTLDFSIVYQNNGGGLPGPSDWDIRFVATVPAAELPDWIPAGATPSAAPDRSWLSGVPTALDLSGISEWYDLGQRQIGLDRARAIVVYRAWTQ